MDPQTPVEIIIEGAKTNNLKDLSLSFPIGAISVVTGVSGSGKSSLVFDTLYAESYRRYVESLSSFARQYLKALPRPQLSRVENLPPAIAVAQARSRAGGARSTVGTMTELNDLLRVLFAQLCEVICYQCGERIERHTGDTVAADIVARYEKGSPALITAPLSAWGKLKDKELRTQLASQGFVRVLVSGQVSKISEIDSTKLKGSAVIVDRIKVESENIRRLADACGLALTLGRGTIAIQVADQSRSYTSEFRCVGCNIDYAEPSPALLSFNHPFGACSNCQGFGYESALDWEKVFPDPSLSLSTAGVMPWNFGSHDEMYVWAKQSARRCAKSYTKKFEDYSEDDWQWLKLGAGESSKDFSGVIGYFTWLESKKHKMHYRIHAARFRKYVLCSSCHGARLGPKGLACKVAGKHIHEASLMTLVELQKWLLAQQESSRGTPSSDDLRLVTMGTREAFEEAQARLSYLNRVGLGYLDLSRQGRTLSGGETQRIQMARCLGSALTDTLYCLDEPTSGLHARDSTRLLEIVRELRDQGNTVVMVEHEKTMIEGADLLYEIGPDAGHRGGELVSKTVRDQTRPIATDKIDWPVREHKAIAKSHFLHLKGARTHNLKDIDVDFPKSTLIGVCGVSGSGKTSLIQHTLYPMLAKMLGVKKLDGYTSDPVAKSLGPEKLVSQFGQVVLVSQAALGRSSRSNIATYLKVADEIRKILAAQPVAKSLGLKASAFSFNSPGGRCETCRGLGTVIEDLSFLGEMAIRCPDCEGQRFLESVLSVKYRELSLIELLDLTVLQARELFFDHRAIKKSLDQVISMGLGYVTLGQQTSSFSGGEAQRLKLVKLMMETKNVQPAFLIFDEPTTGLSDRDVAQLCKQFQALTNAGHTVLVVEHHLGFLRSCDWLIEIGPDAADNGGDLVYQGPVAGLAECPQSLTAPYLFS